MSLLSSRSRRADGPLRRPAGRRWAVVGLVALGMAVPGVSAGQAAAAEPTAAPLAAVTQAVVRTLGLTAGVSMELAGATSLGPGSQVVRATGSYDFPGDRGGVILAPARGVNEPIVFTPLEVFIRPPAGAASLLPKKKPWMVANFVSPEALATNFPQFVLQIESVDPGFTLAELSWGAVTAESRGTTTVGGAPARRYRVTVDLGQAAARATGPARTPFAYAIASERANQSGSANQLGAMTVDVWVDSHGRVVRVADSPPGAGVGTTTLDLGDFGRLISVTAPAASHVVDVAEIAPNAERENNGRGDSDGG